VNQELPPADWYPDPEQPGMQRYWDGRDWTEHRAPIAPPAPQPWEYAAAPQAERKSTGLIIGGWIGALFFSPAGLVCGIILLTRGEQGHGIAITVLSALSLVVGIIVVVAANGGSSAAV
jgi:predicted lipid-binding transport protein (Tim44 family)